MGLHKNYSTAVSPVKVAPPLKIKRYLRAAENYYRYKVLEANDGRKAITIAESFEGRIDLVLTEPGQRKSLGIECKFQGGPGTAEEKIPATIADIAAWPIAGLVVFEGIGFTANMRSYLVSTGRAVEFSDLESWLRLFFGLNLP